MSDDSYIHATVIPGEDNIELHFNGLLVFDDKDEAVEQKEQLEALVE